MFYFLFSKTFCFTLIGIFYDQHYYNTNEKFNDAHKTGVFHVYKQKDTDVIDYL